ncbi:Flp pilus assembly protein CpaB [Primorskyibacter aestuariivivens]|uniref:Flp pilus assembly protein CpaB n=1 Tax=Primorskyibacter aestuariivivens TaxID=1888912 RepID=UPI0023004D26|nr:Flp pilus assembly protein CpaB [Primorskyibacter aestuariivivens]MDA7428444.1 Flp pilus assembly protein CpaB [Primorskyibacter aestuariivivens]
MRVVFGLVLVAGVALAGLAVYMANGYMNSYRTALSKAKSQGGVDMVKIFVAKEKLKYGEKLEKSMVRVVNYPTSAVPDGAFLLEGGALPYYKPWDEFDEDTLDEMKQTLSPEMRAVKDGLRVSGIDDLFPENGQDRFILRTIEKGESILAMKVTEPGQDAGITSRISKGMRAFAIKVDVASGVSGFLRPGDRVDVYWTGRVEQIGEQRRGSQDVTKLIETGVQLIAVDQTADGNNSTTTIARTVTVAARPQQVAALAQAQSTGRLSLALVGTNDDSDVGAVEVDQMSLLGLEAPEEEVVVEQKKEEVCTIRTRKGAEVVEIPIPCTN